MTPFTFAFEDDADYSLWFYGQSISLMRQRNKNRANDDYFSVQDMEVAILYMDSNIKKIDID